MKSYWNKYLLFVFVIIVLSMPNHSCAEEFQFSDPVLVLDVGGEGEYDSLYVANPCPVLVNDEIYLYYTGHDENHKARIGLAKSTNGEVFTKHGVVLDYGVPNIDDRRVRDPMVIYDKDTGNFQMWYIGVGIDWYLCYAESEDGVSFTKYENNPIMVKNYEENRILSPMVILDNNKYKMWYDARWDVRYAESPDGKKWHKVGNFLRGDDKGKWSSRSVCTLGVIITEDSNKKIFFFCGDNYNGPEGKKLKIGLGYLSNDNRVFTYSNNPVISPEGNYDYGIVNAKVIILDGYMWIYFMGLSSESPNEGNGFARIFLTKISLSDILVSIEDKELWNENINN